MCFSCSTRQVDMFAATKEYLSDVKTIELDPSKYSSYEEYHSVVSCAMNKSLSQIDKPEDLQIAFWTCYNIWISDVEPTQDQLQWIDPYRESMVLIMYRLSDLQTVEAAEILVEMYCDPMAGWDAGSALMAGDAIVKCASYALPFLEKNRSLGLDVERLIKLIESGAKTGL